METSAECLEGAASWRTLTMCMESSPFSLVDSSMVQGTGVRCCVMSTTGVPLRQLEVGTLLGMSCIRQTQEVLHQ